MLIALILFAMPLVSGALNIDNPFKGRWEGDVYYYNDSNYNKTLQAGFKRWEETGINVNFRETKDQDEADFVIKSDQNLLKEKCDNCLGWATIGDARFRQEEMLLPVVPSTLENEVINFQVLGTAIHEIGHVLGLDHNNEVCSVMNTDSFCRQEFKVQVSKEGSFMFCGPWQEDLNQLKDLYPEANNLPDVCVDKKATPSFYYSMYQNVLFSK